MKVLEKPKFSKFTVRIVNLSSFNGISVRCKGQDTISELFGNDDIDWVLIKPEREYIFGIDSMNTLVIRMHQALKLYHNSNVRISSFTTLIKYNFQTERCEITIKPRYKVMRKSKKNYFNSDDSEIDLFINEDVKESETFYNLAYDSTYRKE